MLTYGFHEPEPSTLTTPRRRPGDRRRGRPCDADAILRTCGRAQRSVRLSCDEARRTVRVIDVVTHLDVDRPAADVFAFVSDQLNAPRWQRGLHEVRRTTDGPIGVGSQHVFVRRFAGRRIESRNRFVEFEPGRYLAFEIPTVR